MTNTPLNPDAVTVVARALNEAGWTCYEGGMEPGNYDKCEDCQEVCDKIARKALAALPVAQPVVNSVEVIPAQVQVISWEEKPEHECWKLNPDETFVGLIVKSERSWSPADRYALNIERTIQHEEQS